MAPTSRFPFHLPSRKPSTVREPEFSFNYIASNEVVREPIFKTNSKVEKILGHGDFSEARPSKGNKPEKNKPSQRKLSFSNSIAQELQHPTRQGSGPSSPGFLTQASSPILGKNAVGTTSDLDSITDGNSLGHRRRGSSSTLRSYYDPVKSPLAISQQTSASSARDMALRKGCPTVSNHAGHASSPRIAEQLSEDEALIRKSPIPPQLDLSMLFPKPGTSMGPLLSPERITSSPSTMSLASDSHHFPPSPKRNWISWKSNRSKEVSSKGRGIVMKDNSQNGKVHMCEQSKPRIREKNWFDECEDLKESEEDIPGTLSPVPIDGPTRLRRNPGVSSQSSSTSARNVKSQPSHRILPVDKPSTRKSLQSWESRSTYSTQSTRSTYLGNSSIFSTNIHNQSVLSLSSSDDDSELDTEPVLRPERKPTNAHVDRINAEHRDFKEPRLDPSYHTPKSSLSTTYSEEGSAWDHAGLSLSGSIKSVTQSASTLEKRVSLETSRSQRHVSASSDSTPISPSNSFQTLHQRTSSRTSRIMAVTRGEEKLLEAMRQRRAAMQRVASVGKSTVVFEQNTNIDSPRRPKTADAAKRTSSYFDADMSCFPSPPRLESVKALEDVDRAVMIDNLPARFYSTSVERPSFETRMANSELHSDLPLNFSLGRTEALPSPSTSQESPITPRSDLSSRQLHLNNHAMSLPERFMTLGKDQPLRQRPSSKATPLFDGAQIMHAHDDEDENDLAQWALDNYL
ncbi:hypothetical protein MMC20_003706 [Loxospora ochrophaea]|nr:hypothetical protein [Loxospora ochrophaea]